MKITRLLSSGFLVVAVALVAYGLFGLSRFTWYTGEYYDERMVVFDHGFYPFAWGIALLVIWQIARLNHRLPAMLAAAGAALAAPQPHRFLPRYRSRSPGAAMYPPRPNIHAAGVVNDGLALPQSANRYQVAHFMHEHGIAFRVIVRVLAPHARVRRTIGLAQTDTLSNP